jgi:ribosomal protein L12E/L44/L45/RPP1/RPP2
LQKPFQIEERLRAIIKAYGVEEENGALRELIELAGTNMKSLINEIRKQIEYAGERRKNH